MNKNNVTKDGVDGSGVSIATAGRNGTAEGMEALVAQWVMIGASVAEADASDTSITENCGS